MADNVNLNAAKDTVYTLNGYGAIGGLQRWNYSYAANETDHNEIGNAATTATSTEPSTTISFEVTDTGALAGLLARMVYDYATQDYTAGVDLDITTNAFSFDHEDLQYLIFTAGEYKAPGSTFSEAVLFPYHFVTSLGIRLSSDNVGSISFDAQGSLFKPLYKPYHTTRAYPVQWASTTTADLSATWTVNSGTHNILALEINNKMLDDSVVAWSGALEVTISSGTTIDANDRLMLWAFQRTAGSLPTIDYTNTIKFVKPDRISIWLDPEGTAVTDATKYLRVQSVDLTVGLDRDELKEIARNNQRTAVFFRDVKYPLDITGQVRVYETDLVKFAALQGKTLNDSATTAIIDDNNVLDIASWNNAQLVVEWYAYGNDNPLQRMICSGVTISGYDSTQEVLGRKESTWNISTSTFYLEGFDL